MTSNSHPVVPAYTLCRHFLTKPAEFQLIIMIERSKILSRPSCPEAEIQLGWYEHLVPQLEGDEQVDVPHVILAAGFMVGHEPPDVALIEVAGHGRVVA